MRRARTEQAKEQRRDAILGAAVTLLDRDRYDAVTMAAVAREAGIAKGTTYLYFRTKEQLFLALLEEEYSGWFGAARVALRALPEGASLARVTDALVATVGDRPRFLALMQLLHVVLEQNISVETALAFKTRLRDEVTGLALVLSEVTGMEMMRAGKLLMHLHAVVIGLRQLARPSPSVAEALSRDDLAVMRVEFDVELKVVLHDLLRAATSAVTP
ncbi:MAG: TetR family transcriptional regulator [Deltaproteobacteria bacterium]|nr:TetR family transcriptional regulator [Deltaproteobacteria bacterium]